MSELPIGYVGAAADREKYDRIMADIKRAETHQQEMLELANRTKIIADQGDHNTCELQIALEDTQKSLNELRDSIPGILAALLQDAFAAKAGAK